ncbi:MAG TPA: metallophosphoesterase family protein, partial [Candidatus Hydrogenedentes bacterium]|nr:metallophosphoesterase family protein [Candidatus Hydrogenedentota bacterium]
EGIVYYDTAPHGQDFEAYRFRAAAAPHRVPGIEDKRAVYSVELANLEPGSTYYFIYGVEGRRFSAPQQFRTVPNDGSPVRFVVGGDVSVHPRARRLLRQAAATDPDFVVIGGDIAYANGDPKNLWLWDYWLQIWRNSLRTQEKRVIPGVFALGNHETNDDFEEPERNAPFFFGFFAQGGSPYFALQFGPDLALIMLDSGHTVPHDGAQKEWLEATLQELEDVPLKMAVYHVPFYPSHRGFDGSLSVAGREHWLPLFDAHGVAAGFEHHDHTFKRTKPLRGGQVDPEGTVYLGDGCMGVPPREIKNEGAWYLEKASGTPHFWLVTVADGAATYEAIDIHGEVFDRYPED